MAKTYREEIYAILENALKTYPNGLGVTEAREKFKRLSAYDDSQVRYTLDSAVKAGTLRKVGHRKIITPFHKPAAAYTHVDNLLTNDLALYVSSERGPITRKNGKTYSPVASSILEYLRENQGIKKVDLVSHIQALGHANGNIYAQLSKLVKNKEVKVDEGGGRFRALVFTSDYVVPRKSDAPQAEALSEVSQEAESVPAPAINGNHVNAASAPQAAPSGTGVDFYLKGLAQAIADQLTAQIVQAIGANLANVMGSMGSVKIPSGAELVQQVTQAAEKPRKPKVLILGLNNHSAGQIVADFPGLNLSFVEKNSIGKHTADVIKSADRVIAMTDFIGHNLDVKSNDHPGFERLSGGITRLKERLQIVALRQSPAAYC